MSDLPEHTNHHGQVTEVVERPVSEHPVAQAMRYVYEVVKTVAIVLVVALLIRSFVAQPFVVDGSSMEPTFHNHEYLMVEKLPFSHTLNRGDIIVFRYPLDTSLNYVKRVVGLPGDRVVIAGGTVTIYNNRTTAGLILNEPYLPPGTRTTVAGEPGEHSWIVDQNNYFVMGDNRDHSDDSRSWGFVPSNDVIGKVGLTVFPFEDFGTLQHPQY